MSNLQASSSNRVGLVYDPIYLEHDTGAHVETASRLVAIRRQLDSRGLLDRTIALDPRPATVDELLTVHSMEYITRLEQVSRRGGGWLDGDTILSDQSYDAALSAAGGVIEAVKATFEKQVDSAFALVRPPGHHATQSQGMGFCLFNNAAIAAKVALKQVDRILIADFDVHHGNGTQDILYEDPSVLYFSTHQSPHYPGTGSVGETGAGAGKGATINVPMPSGCGDEEYLTVYNEILVPAARRFQPQLILVSAGYDSHWSDPLSSMRLSTTGFVQIASIMKGLADELCQGHLVFTLEGGYDLDALAQSIRATVEMLLGEPEIDDPLGPPHFSGRSVDIGPLLERVKQTHGLG